MSPSTVAKAPIILVALAIWAVVGFLFWIPVLFRATAAFSGGVLYSALTNSSTKDVDERLHNAVGFYVFGFRRILGALRDPEPTEGGKKDTFKFGFFLGEVVWAGLFWLTCIYVFQILGILQTSLGSSLEEFVGSLVSTVRGWIGV